MEKISHLGATLTQWRVGPSTFLAWPEKGARLMSWSVMRKDGSQRDVVHWPAAENLADFYKTRGGNPILFPFNARTYDRGDIHFWRDPTGVRRPMPMHGLARQGDFEVTRLDAAGFTARFLPGAEAHAAYPFNYEFLVTYRFEPLAVACDLVLTNRGNAPLPWSSGHHFYFSLPWRTGASRRDYTLRLPAGKRLRQDFTTGQLKPGPNLPAEVNFSSADLVDTIHTDLRSSVISFGEPGAAEQVIMRVGSDSAVPPGSAVVTWTYNEDAPFYCVEPWMGPPNAPEHKIGLHLIPPGQTETFTVRIETT